MVILGIETSCDETGLALLRCSRPITPSTSGLPEVTILGQALHSQTALHAAYGGVVPELASRDHLLRMAPLLQDCLKQAGLALHEIDHLAVTQGPGLAGALLVGTSLAQGLAAALQKPLMGIHHLEGHLLSPLLDAQAGELDFPFLALLVSGGHSQIMRVDGIGHYQLLGETIDDAAGEAFDKTAQLLGLGYPGGPALSACARKGRADRFALPRPLIHRPSLDFSFAGLKTAVMTQANQLRDGEGRLTEQDRNDLAASTEAAIVDCLVAKAAKALDQTGLQQLVVSGGVSANSRLRAALDQLSQSQGIRVLLPAPALCTDNGVMIAWAAGLRLLLQPDQAQGHDLRARPRWPLERLSGASPI